jgi:RecA/RadA recombinase
MADEKDLDKLKKELMAQFNKEFDSPLEVMSESSLANIPGWISTNNYALNWAISKDIFKGVAMSKVALFSGDPGAGKSMIALSMMGGKDLDLIIYFDSEGGGITTEFAEFLGVDPTKILYSTVDTVEDLIAKLEKTIDVVSKNKQNKNILMIIDSISMISTEREVDPNGGADMGCYTPDTLVPTLAQDDKTIINKHINEIKLDDKVLTHLNSWEKVTKIFTYTKEEKPELIEIESVDGDIIKLTPNHRLLVSHDSNILWIEASSILETDLLQKMPHDFFDVIVGKDDIINKAAIDIYKSVGIKSIKKIENTDNVYDLEVEGAHTYCTGDNIIGHNSKARLLRQFFRTYIRKLQKLNIATVITAHLTENIGGYGPAKVVSGGTSLGYAPSVEVRFSKVNAESETERNAIGTSMVKIRAEIIKSRFGTTGKIIKFDLDMERGLDLYAGLFDIMRDYGFIIPAASDLEKQIEEKNIPKKSTGWWIFKPWDNEKTIELYNKMQEKGLTSEGGKFRENKIKEFCADNKWFLDDVSAVLASIYDKKDLEQDLDNEDLLDSLANGADVLNEESEDKSKKSRKKTTITEISSDIENSVNIEESSDVEDSEKEQTAEEA